MTKYAYFCGHEQWHPEQLVEQAVLAERAGWVREDVRRDLPAVPRSLAAAIAEGKRTFAEAGGPRAYFGDPAAATADEGRNTIAVLGAILADAVVEALGGGPGDPGP